VKHLKSFSRKPLEFNKFMKQKPKEFEILKKNERVEGFMKESMR